MSPRTVTVVGSYPRPPREGGTFHLRRTLQALDRGEATVEDVEAAQDALIAEIIQEQVAAGVEVVTDGQVRWENPLTRVAQGLEGFSISGLIRYFDNNTYFRRPVVKAPVARTQAILVEEYRFAADASPVPVKAVMPGPYTLAVTSKDEHYGDVRALARDLAAALGDEARELAAVGAGYVQFDEPALARIPGQPAAEFDVFAEVADSLVEGVQATTFLTTYFGDVAAIGPDLFSLPFDVFGLDLVSGAANLELIEAFPPNKQLQAGIVDARNTKMESVEQLERLVGELSRRVSEDRLWLSPSAGLEFLPREAAQRKLERLAEVKEPRR